GGRKDQIPPELVRADPAGSVTRTTVCQSSHLLLSLSIRPIAGREKGLLIGACGACCVGTAGVCPARLLFAKRPLFGNLLRKSRFRFCVGAGRFAMGDDRRVIVIGS